MVRELVLTPLRHQRAHLRPQHGALDDGARHQRRRRHVLQVDVEADVGVHEVVVVSASGTVRRPVAVVVVVVVIVPASGADCELHRRHRHRDGTSGSAELVHSSDGRRNRAAAAHGRRENRRAHVADVNADLGGLAAHERRQRVRERRVAAHRAARAGAVGQPPVDELGERLAHALDLRRVERAWRQPGARQRAVVGEPAVQ
mmetsp:Transcript_2281/g.7630  ORF Transcript_2281/g.7630 Transcript_2281/m.7630 type:complete len:202 (+) Transcript_2281:2305-2910(+)